jgi:hypothetical protein
MIINVAELKNQITVVRAIGEIPSSTRAKLIETGLARAVAYGVDLPTSPVGNPITYFASNGSDAKACLAAINEVNVIDISRILNLATTIWLARYNMVFVPSSRESMELTAQVLTGQKEWLFDASQQEFLATTEGDGQTQDVLKLALLNFTAPAVISLAQVVPTDDNSTEE